jgi:hypothetical protein
MHGWKVGHNSRLPSAQTNDLNSGFWPSQPSEVTSLPGTPAARCGILFEPGGIYQKRFAAGCRTREYLCLMQFDKGEWYR